MTITRDQTATGQADPDNTATITLTWATAPTAGSKALVYIGSTASISTVKDNGTTQSTFTADASWTTDGFLAVYRADGIHLPASGSYAVTVTLSGDAYAHASGRTYLGMATGAPAATNSGSGTGTSVATGNVTPPAAGSLVAGVFADASSANPETITLTTSGASTVYTSTNGAADLAGAAADNITSGVTAQGLAWTIGDSAGWDALVAVYSPAATAHTPTASLTVTPSFTAAATSDAGAALTVTPSLSASASGGVVELTDSPVTSSTGAATSGVFTTANAFSPAAGSMVLVRVENLFTSATSGAATFTCQDSHGNTYTSAVQGQNSYDVAGAAIFWHVYSSAPGSTTLTITSSNTTVALELLVSPTVITGQASSPIGPNTISIDPSGSTTSLTASLTTTQEGSRAYLAGGVGTGSAMTAASGTTATATYNGYNNAATGIATSATGTPGATSFGWTCSPASAFGGNLVGVEVLVAGSTTHTPTASLTVSPSFTATPAGGTAAALTVSPSFTAQTSVASHTGTPILDSAGNGILDSAGTQILDTAGSSSAALTITPVLGASGSATAGAETATAALTVTPAFTASGATGTAAALTVTPVLAASAATASAASLTVTPVLGASAGDSTTAALTVTPVLAASSATDVSAALTVTPVLSASATRGAASWTGSASLTVTPAFTASGATGTAAALTVTPVLAASGTATAAGTDSAALTVTPAFTATIGTGKTAALTVTPVLAATPAAGAGASLTVTPTLTALASAAESAALTVLLSLTAQAAGSTTAALTVSPDFTATGTAASGSHTATASLTVTPSMSALTATATTAALTVSPAFTVTRTRSGPSSSSGLLMATGLC